jgi:hypothetical protein
VFDDDWRQLDVILDDAREKAGAFLHGVPRTTSRTSPRRLGRDTSGS